MAFKYIKLSLLSITLILSSFVLDVICFIPPPRFAQTSALIGDNIYYMGGIVPLPEPIISDFFYLNIPTLNSTIPETLPWTELAGLDNLFTSWGTAVAGGANKDLFVLFGGQMTPVDNSSLVIVYDTKSNTWSKPTITVLDVEPIRRKQTQAVIDSAGKMYIFGGSTGPETNSPESIFLNDMAILDTVNWSWSTGTLDGAPEARHDFSATILSNGVIVYIGGSNLDNRYVPMSQIATYDTNSAAWSSLVATGNIPNPRGGHSAVLMPNERIIIYGGALLIADGQYIAANPDIAVLETTDNNFVWSQPKASGTAPPSIAYHSASLVGDHMIVSFGNVTSKGPSSDVYVLDTKDNDYKWITSMTPVAPDAPTAPADAGTGSDSGNQSSGIGAILGILAGGVVGIILLGGGLFWFYRYKKNKEMMEGVIETPGELTDAGFSRRYEAMNSTTTSQASHDLHSKRSSSATDFDPSREFHPTYSHNFPVQHDPEIEDKDDKEFKILPQELQPEYLEKKYNI